VSEFPCGSPPLQFHFPRRNRIISGAHAGTIVVEAADDSGSLITARHALEQDRQVFRVPGPVGVPAHHGPNRLIQQGAKLVLSARDVIEELWPELLPRLAARRAAAAEAALRRARAADPRRDRSGGAARRRPESTRPRYRRRGARDAPGARAARSRLPAPRQALLPARRVKQMAKNLVIVESPAKAKTLGK